MTVAEKIHQRVLVLPTPMQAEVLNFVEFLLTKVETEVTEMDDREWANFSLEMAMRGMEDEPGPEYTLADLKERF
jgi:hypothetical protein